jgi:hypothetical protein
LTGLVEAALNQLVTTNVSTRETLTLLPFGLQIIGLSDRAQVEPQQLILGITKHPAERAIDVEKGTMFAHKCHRVRRTVESVGKRHFDINLDSWTRTE